jgi:hypothetical protein
MLPIRPRLLLRGASSTVQALGCRRATASDDGPTCYYSLCKSTYMQASKTFSILIQVAQNILFMFTYVGCHNAYSLHYNE